MIDLRGFLGFTIHSAMMSDIEGRRLYTYCITKDIPCIKTHGDPPENYVPWGGVDWVQKALGYTPVPDYYPSWAPLRRKVWRDSWILGRPLFVKPADRYKRFTGFVTTGTYKGKKKGDLIWSEVVSFTNEWRYYITNGKVMCAGWYDGDQENENPPEPPPLDFEIPDDYSGALDMGETSQGLTLVESQHPFSCGWYGEKKDDEIYFQWLIDGFAKMKTIR